MWTRRVWEMIGGFDPAYDAAEDFEFWLRAREHFELVRCPGPAGLRGAAEHCPDMGSLQFGEKQLDASHRAIVARRCAGAVFDLITVGSTDASPWGASNRRSRTRW